MTPTGLEVRRAASNSPEVSTFQAAQFTDALKRVYQAKAIRAFVCISSDMMMDALINQPVTFTKRGFGAENRGRHILGRYYARWRPSQDIASRLEAITTIRVKLALRTSCWDICLRFYVPREWPRISTTSFAPPAVSTRCPTSTCVLDGPKGCPPA